MVNFGIVKGFLGQISNWEIVFLPVHYFYSKVEFALLFCSKLALTATYVMSSDINMNFNCMIGGPQTSRLHIRSKSDKNHP